MFPVYQIMKRLSAPLLFTDVPRRIRWNYLSRLKSCTLCKYLQAVQINQFSTRSFSATFAKYNTAESKLQKVTALLCSLHTHIFVEQYQICEFLLIRATLNQISTVVVKTAESAKTMLMKTFVFRKSREADLN